ncbi:MAG: hypothetical protein AB1651_06595 [Pseudomonadota bacterium]|jgi:hypothetical protein
MKSPARRASGAREKIRLSEPTNGRLGDAELELGGTALQYAQLDAGSGDRLR